eukprot:COSAG02_NODE_9_length_59728_cov_36.104714_35_plen_74_part_00
MRRWPPRFFLDPAPLAGAPCALAAHRPRAVNSILVHISLNLHYQHTKLYVLLYVKSTYNVNPVCPRAARVQLF